MTDIFSGSCSFTINAKRSTDSASGITTEAVVRNYLAPMAAGKFTEILDELIENDSVGFDPAHKSSVRKLPQ